MSNSLLGLLLKFHSQTITTGINFQFFELCQSLCYATAPPFNEVFRVERLTAEEAAGEGNILFYNFLKFNPQPRFVPLPPLLQ